MMLLQQGNTYGRRSLLPLVSLLPVIVSILMGCDASAGEVSAPGNVRGTDVQNATGAAGMYVAARESFQEALSSFIVTTGLFTDELQASTRGVARTNLDALTGEELLVVDSRRLPEINGFAGPVSVTNGQYDALHRVRKFATQAIGALALYDSAHAAGRRGLLYADMGYAELYLADLFCSGIPLSTYDFNRDITYHAGASTDDVYRQALAHFDTALQIGADSVPVVNLARVGRGRALLSLGRYAEARQAVRNVEPSFVLAESISTCGYSEIVLGELSCSGVDVTPGHALFTLMRDGSVADRKGVNGLPYRTNGDPRTSATFAGTVPSRIRVSLFTPTKYVGGGVNPLVVASGIEAQLITAEAALQSGEISTWYTMLRDLRTTGSYSRIDTSFNYDTTFGGASGTDVIDIDTTIAEVDTLWDAGTGGLAGIRPLPVQEPGSALSGKAATDARVDLLFRERAYWLFLTGQRQGDLRRLVRRPEYRRLARDVYPVGAYDDGGTYADFIDAPIPVTERPNTLFHGCQSRD